MTQRIVWAVLGAVLGVWAALSPGSLFVISLVGVSCWWFSAIPDRRLRRFLIGLFLAGFLVRAAVSLGLDAVAWAVKRGPPFKWYQPTRAHAMLVEDQTRGFLGMGDSDYYSSRAYAMSLYVRGVREPVTTSTPYRDVGPYGWNGYLYVLGFFYYLFGFAPYAIKLLTCWLGALVGPALYVLTAEWFAPRVARWAGALAAFVPSLVFWSASNLKDMPFIFLTLALLILFVRMRRARRLPVTIAGTALFTGILLAHATMRQGIFSLSLAACLAASWWLTSSLSRRIKLAGLALVLAATAMAIHVYLRPVLARVIYFHAGHVRSPGDSYQYLPNEFLDDNERITQLAQGGPMNQSMAVATGRAVTHYLLEPLPWKIDSRLEVAAYPQMVLWYICLGAALWGIIVAFRRRAADVALLVGVMAVWVVIGAMTGGNIGTAFRMRDMISPFLVMFACAGAIALCCGTRAIDPEPSRQ